MNDGQVSLDHLNEILECGLRVPDHGALNPWKITVIQGEAKKRIGNEILAKEYKLSNPEASNDDLDYEKNRFNRASIVIVVLCTPVFHPKIPKWEMELSSGAVCSNLLIAAQSLGYAAQWLTEWYSYNQNVLKEFGGDPKTDKIAGFIYIGNKQKEPVERRRPIKNKIISFIDK
jgi:nitroreductase